MRKFAYFYTMRKTNDIINLILDIYHGHEWEDMEEFFVSAHAILLYHGARFKLLDDIKEDHRQAIFRSIVDNTNGKFYGCNRASIIFSDFVQDSLDSDNELIRLEHYDDSEEGFREELNSNTRETSTQIFHKFITFKD